MAASTAIEKQEKSEEKVAMSLKYQVLCKETAIVGVQKQTDSVTGELKESTIKFGRSELGGFEHDYDAYGGGIQTMSYCAAPMMMSRCA